jgi:hypothetical protein
MPLSVKTLAPHKEARKQGKSESEITMCDRMQMYNIKKKVIMNVFVRRSVSQLFRQCGMLNISNP